LVDGEGKNDEMEKFGPCVVTAEYRR